jgi:hypothetical protein
LTINLGIKNLIKNFAPIFFLIFIYKILLCIRIFRYKNRKIFYPLCEKETKTFYAGLFPWIFLTCSGCFSLSRHRIIANYLKKQNLNNKIIGHFAAEEGLKNFIKKKFKIQIYKCFDYDANNNNFKTTTDTLFLDIENINSEHFNTYDYIICNHVLEHVNFPKAILNLKKMLKKNGKILLTFPIIDRWKKSYINLKIQSEYERTLHFQQFDHLQLFGQDIENYLECKDFKLLKITPFGNDTVKFGIHQGETLFLLKKNN